MQRAVSNVTAHVILYGLARFLQRLVAVLEELKAGRTTVLFDAVGSSHRIQPPSVAGMYTRDRSLLGWLAVHWVRAGG